MWAICDFFWIGVGFSSQEIVELEQLQEVLVGVRASCEREMFHIYNDCVYKVGFVNVKCFISTMIVCIRLDLVFDSQGCATNVSPKEKGYICFKFVVGKKDSSKTKVRNIKICLLYTSPSPRD